MKYFNILLSVLVTCGNIPHINTEPIYGNYQTTNPVDLNIKFTNAAYLTSLKVISIVETLRPCSYNYIYNTTSPKLKLLLNSCFLWFKSMDSAVGFAADGIYSKLVLISADLTTDGKCLYNQWIPKYNLHNKFLALLREVIFYIKTYANQDAGNQLTTKLTAITTKSQELQVQLKKATNESSRIYNDPSIEVFGQPLNTIQADATAKIVTILDELYAYWTDVETIVRKYVPSVLFCIDVVTRLDTPISAKNSIDTSADELFKNYDKDITLIFQGFNNYTTNLINIMLESFIMFFERVRTSGDAAILFKSELGPLLSNTAKTITQKSNNVSSGTTDANYFSQYEQVKVGASAAAEFVAQSYSCAIKICNKVLAKLTGYNVCLDLKCWNCLIGYNTRNVDAANCRYTRIYKLWDKNSLFFNLTIVLQREFTNFLYTECYPCAYKSIDAECITCIKTCVDKFKVLRDQYETNANKFLEDFRIKAKEIYDEIMKCIATANQNASTKYGDVDSPANSCNL